MSRRTLSQIEIQQYLDAVVSKTTKKDRAKEMLDKLLADDELMSEFNLQLRHHKIKKIKDGNK